jgi:protoporphyrin/coproporphyrin ferrochelatase
MKSAVLLVAHGTVSDLSELPAFLRVIRRGKDPSPELIAEMRRRYEAIGQSPLLSITASVAKKLEARVKMPVRVAMRLWKPFVRDVLRDLMSDGIERVIVLPLAQYSTHVYGDAAKKTLGELVREGGRNIMLECVKPWGSKEKLLDAFAKRIALPEPDKTLVVFTAHSLPKSVIDAGDPYEKEFLASVKALRDRISAPHAMHAFQSQGADGGDWLGPDLKSAIEVARENEFSKMLIAPIGFLADHLEILYDIDIEARALAKGIALSRTESLNDSDDFISVLEDLIR